MVTVSQTETFAAWLSGFRDRDAGSRIVARLARLEMGHVGDGKPVGEGVSELRLHHGPGYRVNFVQRGRERIILLCGGGKSTQDADIDKAKRLAKEQAP